MAMTLFREFTVEAGRYLPHLPAHHPCAHMHGHTFIIQVHVTGETRPDTGWVMDFAELDRLLQDVRRSLDHKVLNEVDGLENPTTEQMARWIWQRLHDRLPGLSRVEIRENPYSGCSYTGD